MICYVPYNTIMSRTGIPVSYRMNPEIKKGLEQISDDTGRSETKYLEHALKAQFKRDWGPEWRKKLNG